ncbi:isoaspartyl peptidase/L-asparaginase family protein [Bacteroidota bacterium]
MKILIYGLFTYILIQYLVQDPVNAQGDNTQFPITIVIHGGAGTITRENMTSEKEDVYRTKLTEALDAGYTVLESGGNSLDAVTTAITILEDSPLFNAGKGAVFTSEGKNELDASIMEGKTRTGGAVAGVTTIKNPILAARAVMEKSEHVLLTGIGAEEFAEQNGLEIVDPEYFYTEKRYKSLERAKQIEQEEGFHRTHEHTNHKFGTVGALALDINGNLVAGTSTGGMTNKKYGRIGDSPIIGAGTYADNNSCAVSATGHGEYFIRYVVSYDVAARMMYLKESAKQAAETVINNKLKKVGGSGGIIVLDKDGNIAMPFNTPGMYRGFKKQGEKAQVFIYED